MNLLPGTQVIKVPNPADKKVNLADCEIGFVTSGPNSQGDYFCRYWSKKNGSLRRPLELRTKSCSELTPVRYLRIKYLVAQDYVDKAMWEFCQN